MYNEKVTELKRKTKDLRDHFKKMANHPEEVVGVEIIRRNGEEGIEEIKKIINENGLIL